MLVAELPDQPEVFRVGHEHERGNVDLIHLRFVGDMVAFAKTLESSLSLGAVDICYENGEIFFLIFVLGHFRYGSLLEIATQISRCMQQFMTKNFVRLLTGRMLVDGLQLLRGYRVAVEYDLNRIEMAVVRVEPDDTQFF